MLRQGIPQRRIARSEQAIFQRINVQLSGLVQHQAKTSPLGLLGHLIRRPPCIGWFHVNFDRHFDIGHGKAPLIDWKSGSHYDIAKLTVQVAILEAIERTAGMSNITTPGGGAAVFSSRGFTGNNAVMLLYNGTRFYVGAETFTLPLDTWHLERVEVLRGTASVLYGEGAIGGAINLVSKRPRKEAREYQALASYGSWDTVRLGIGSGGPLADNLFYRVDLSRQSSEGFVDRADYERWTFGSSLLYELTDRFSITLAFDYWKNDDAAYFGTPFINGRIDPRTRKINYNILDSKAVYEDYWTRLELDWKVTNNLELHNETYAYIADRHWRNLENYAFVPSTGLINRTGFLEIIHNQTQIGDRLHALINHNLFGHNNRFLLGFDVNSIDFERPTNDFSGSSDVDPFNPNLGRFLDFTGTAVPRRESTTDQFSLFAEDTLAVSDPLK